MNPAACEDVAVAAGVVPDRMRGAGTWAGLVESPSHVSGLAVYEESKVDRSPRAVRRGAVRRSGEPGVLRVQFLVREVWPAVTQPAEA